MIAVSACLLGCNCRYDGKNKKNYLLVKSLESELELNKILPVCPEQLGCLGTPRAKSDIINGNGFDVLDGRSKVINIYGVDNTSAFINGAFSALRQIKEQNIRLCFLKAKSPSCGVGGGVHIFMGRSHHNFDGITGVFAALLIKNGIDVKEVGSGSSSKKLI